MFCNALRIRIHIHNPVLLSIQRYHPSSWLSFPCDPTPIRLRSLAHGDIIACALTPPHLTHLNNQISALSQWECHAFNPRLPPHRHTTAPIVFIELCLKTALSRCLVISGYWLTEVAASIESRVGPRTGIVCIAILVTNPCAYESSVLVLVMMFP